MSTESEQAAGGYPEMLANSFEAERNAILNLCGEYERWGRRREPQWIVVNSARTAREQGDGRLLARLSPGSREEPLTTTKTEGELSAVHDLWVPGDICMPAAAGDSPPGASNRSYYWDVEV